MRLLRPCLGGTCSRFLRIGGSGIVAQSSVTVAVWGVEWQQHLYRLTVKCSTVKLRLRETANAPSLVRKLGVF